jgi:hypothetical protein
MESAGADGSSWRQFRRRYQRDGQRNEGAEFGVSCTVTRDAIPSAACTGAGRKLSGTNFGGKQSARNWCAGD